MFSKAFSNFDSSTGIKVPLKKKRAKQQTPLSSIALFNPRKHNLITQPRKLPEKVHIREVQTVVMRFTAVLARVKMRHLLLGVEGFTVKSFFFQMIQHNA